MCKWLLFNHFTNHPTLNQSDLIFCCEFYSSIISENFQMDQPTDQPSQPWRVPRTEESRNSQHIRRWFATIRRSLYYVCDIMVSMLPFYFKVQSKEYSPFECTGVMFQFQFVSAHVA